MGYIFHLFLFQFTHNLDASLKATFCFRAKGMVCCSPMYFGCACAFLNQTDGQTMKIWQAKVFAIIT